MELINEFNLATDGGLCPRSFAEELLEQIRLRDKGLESIHAKLTSFDPDGDDVNYDREQAINEVLKLIKIALGPDEEEQEGQAQ